MQGEEVKRKRENYVGVHNDRTAGISDAGRIIRDAWLFDILPETEDGAGWNSGRIQELYDQVYGEWMKYGHLVSRLPPELRERHRRIYDQAIHQAREHGWDPSGDLEDEA